MHKKIYTGIGSRQTPFEVLDLMTIIAQALSQEGWTLRSGGARGADTAFEIGAQKKDIFIPWLGFNGHGVDKQDAFLPQPGGYELASEHHPAWHRCSNTAQALHARNSHQVMGLELDSPSDMVICWTPGGKPTGGTGQAIRLAQHFGIPIFNLAVHSTQDIENFINHGTFPS